MSLLNDLRIDIGDDDGISLSGVVPIVPPVAPIGTSLGLLLRDFRVDIGDETPNFGSGVFPPALPVQLCLITTAVSSASYNVVSSDALILVTPAAPNTTIILPTSGQLGCVLFIKDAAGTAFLRNIIIDPGSNTIDGLDSFLITQNYQSIAITWLGSGWGII